ncbi:Thioredoxin- transmembrane protein 1 [Blomia tropicalis]|nr:Thioredoxin- transmembrane protein 1 [Blomia tropicalis]
MISLRNSFIAICFFTLFLVTIDQFKLVYGTDTKKANIITNTGGKSPLITINEDDWEQILTGEWMVLFHAPWCPACRALQPEWKSFSGWSSELGIKVGAIDVTTNPGLSGRFLVTALPTIYHVKEGIFRQYKGTRDTNSFASFIEEKTWQSIEPVTSWKAPNSLQMSFVSYLFKISMAFRSVHNSLVEDYGIPYWGSYIVFAFATVLFGALLGLMIVCVIDLIWSTRIPDTTYSEMHQTAPQTKLKDKVDDDDILTESDEKGSGVEDSANSKDIEEITTTDDERAGTNKLRKRRARKDGQ